MARVVVKSASAERLLCGLRFLIVKSAPDRGARRTPLLMTQQGRLKNAAGCMEPEEATISVNIAGLPTSCGAAGWDKKDVILKNKPEKLLKTKGQATWVAKNKPENKAEKLLKTRPCGKN